jgi:hypothetical protein
LAFWTTEGFLHDEAEMLWCTKYDYVEAYDYKGTDETGEPIFELRFRDDFDHFDTDRWILANHTFEGTSTTFVPENAYVEDGNLILKMEKVEDKKPKKPVDPWHVLPPPPAESLDRAIEKSTRVLVTMVRQQLENFAENMSGHLM